MTLLAQGPTIVAKLHSIWPEVALFLTTCVVMVMGLSPSLAIRRQTALVTGLGLAVAGVLAWYSPVGEGTLPYLMPYVKVLVAGIGLLLLLLVAGTVDRTEEQLIAAGRIPFNPLRTNRAEFYAFFLFSLTGVMLCSSADDLIWLFLALELTSLPTYIMVTAARERYRGQQGVPGAHRVECDGNIVEAFPCAFAARWSIRWIRRESPTRCSRWSRSLE